MYLRNRRLFLLSADTCLMWPFKFLGFISGFPEFFLPVKNTFISEKKPEQIKSCYRFLSFYIPTIGWMWTTLSGCELFLNLLRSHRNLKLTWGWAMCAFMSFITCLYFIYFIIYLHVHHLHAITSQVTIQAKICHLISKKLDSVLPLAHPHLPNKWKDFLLPAVFDLDVLVHFIIQIERALIVSHNPALLCWATGSCCGSILVGFILFCIFALLYVWFCFCFLLLCWFNSDIRYHGIKQSMLYIRQKGMDF